MVPAVVCLASLCGCPAAFAAQNAEAAQPVGGVTISGGQWSQDHYSTLSQINRGNVKNLVVAWKYDTGERSLGVQTNPLVVGRVIYAYTSSQKVIALDAVTGKLLWKFDSGIVGTQPVRGLAYWTDGKQSRVLCGVMNYLYALDGSTGRPIPDFAEDGRIDLRKGLRGDYRTQSIVLTSPGVIFKDLIIVGGRNPETPPAPPGDIRAFDVRTGKLVWTFHTIPHPGEPGYSTWPANAWKTAGAANNWAGMTLDEKRGVVYVPTGSAVPDFYGGARAGNDLFANCLLALDAATGKLLWYFQGVHHDTWDRDFPAAPVLLSVRRNGKAVDAIAQTTKQGFVFVFNRDTGKPLFPIVERAVALSNVPGEVSSKTQPFPLLPAPYARQTVTVDDLTNRTPEAHDDALKQFRSFVSGNGQFYPFTVGKETIIAPGFDGGGEWGGPAVDPTRGVIYINANNVVYTGGLAVNAAGAGLGLSTYRSQCALCHGDNRAGSPPAFPSLIGIDKKLTTQQITDTIHGGKGRMPSFPSLQDGRLKALVNYLRTGKDDQSAGHAAETAGDSELQRDDLGIEDSGRAAGKAGSPGADEAAADVMSPEEAEMNRYRFTGYLKFHDQDGYPAVAPPWGTLNAIDLNTGRYLWTIPLGDYPELAAKGMANTGTENYGGPIVTAGGLVVIGATVFDRKLRAFDSRTGALLWDYELPYAAVATPTTYMVDGRQYIVVTAGGSKLADGAPDALYIAFTLAQ